MKYTAYHGTDHIFDQFTIDNVGNGHDQEGPGIYFTSDIDNAYSYGNTVFKVELTLNKLVSTTKPGSKSNIYKMIRKAPNLDDTLSDWSENKKTAMTMLFYAVTNYDTAHAQFQTVWYDSYRYNPVEYVGNMVELLGYDGIVLPSNINNPDIKHYVVFNVSCIKILEKMNVNTEAN